MKRHFDTLCAVIDILMVIINLIVGIGLLVIMVYHFLMYGITMKSLLIAILFFVHDIYSEIRKPLLDRAGS